LENLKGTIYSGRSRHRWEDNIKIDDKGIRCEVVDSIHLLQDNFHWSASVSTGLGFPVPQKTVNFLTSCATVIVTRRTVLCVLDYVGCTYSVSLILSLLASFKEANEYDVLIG
jgi:hypothetical protein